MAVMTEANLQEIRNEFYRFGFGKEELKALPSLPNQQKFLAMVQSIEDDMVGSFSGIKTRADTALGVVTTTPLMQKLFAAYLRWKIKQILGL